MPLILERTVQNKTQEFLEKRYRRKAIGKRIFSKTEMPTKAKYGRKRADGFLAFRHILWGDYVVSMEAKSKKTLPAIKPFRDDFIFFMNCVRVGFYCCLGSGAFYVLWKWNDNLWQYLLPLYVFAFSALTYALLTWKSYRHQTMHVIDQLKQYPANEQWLAFSKDSFESLKKEKQKVLRKICKARGIGLIVYNNKITVLEKPKFRFYFKKDFIKYYSREKEIRNILKS